VYLHDAVVTRTREVARGMCVISLRSPLVASSVRAGQFVNLGLPGFLLRRPFSVYRVQGEEIEVLLKPVGRGTGLLASISAGAEVSVLGPLGRGFEIGSGSGPVVLLSGGLGVAPMPLAAHAARAAGREVVWVHGARTADELCSEWEGDRVVWATDDGSRGLQGTALSAVPDDAGLVLACGPNPMLAAVAERVPDAQVAIETYMGCGTGVCLGCAVPLRAGGYDRACKEGPVYRADAIDWKALPAHLHYGVA
jgi:dihydroorotate dehydrogenase electron transfer subunit